MTSVKMSGFSSLVFEICSSVRGVLVPCGQLSSSHSWSILSTKPSPLRFPEISTREFRAAASICKGPFLLADPPLFYRSLLKLAGLSLRVKSERAILWCFPGPLQDSCALFLLPAHDHRDSSACVVLLCVPLTN